MDQLRNLILENDIKHVAMIMDGNGRWASAQGQDRTYGHKHGAQRVIELTKLSDKLGIEVLSLYAFSTENWKRPKFEVRGIMTLLNSFIDKELNNLIKENVVLRIMGDLSELPLLNRKAVEHAVNKTKNNTGLILNIGLNYGSRAEIVNGFKNILNDVRNGIIEENNIDEKYISDNLYTKGLPDPDILIRTGGELRLSNFMMYQLAYTELFFVKDLWPEFSNEKYIQVLKEFFTRKRRFGGLDSE